MNGHEHSGQPAMTGRGRGWAYTGALLGGTVSVAANVAHSYVPPVNALSGWAPEVGAVIGAVFWPLALFVAVEILTRIAWPAGGRWVWLRFVGLLPVALVAAVVSYRHLSGLLTFYGEDALTATVGPLAVDGLMVMATGALLATAHAKTASEPDVSEATTATTADTTPAVTEAARPAIEVATTPAPVRTRKRTPARTAKRTAPAVDTAVAVAALRAEFPDMSQADMAARLGVSTRTVRRHLSAPSTPDTTATDTADMATADVLVAA
ncbi:MAG TPA: hypothetical protein VIP77_16610 [Jiangellaceae bacterium]